jgi:hypothetical protein
MKPGDGVALWPEPAPCWPAMTWGAARPKPAETTAAGAGRWPSAGASRAAAKRESERLEGTGAGSAGWAGAGVGRGAETAVSSLEVAAAGPLGTEKRRARRRSLLACCGSAAAGVSAGWIADDGERFATVGAGTAETSGFGRPTEGAPVSSSAGAASVLFLVSTVAGFAKVAARVVSASPRGSETG